MKLFVALTLVLLAASPHAPATQPHTTITGRVVAEATGQPVRRAYVIAHGPHTRTTRVTMSDGEGRFTFDGLPSDRYRVGASKRPLLSAVTDATSADVLIALPTGAVVTGTAIDSLGRPVGGIELGISGAGLHTRQVATTTDQGEYRFFGLPPGDYTIAAVLRRSEPRNVTVGAAEYIQGPALATEGPEVPATPGPTITRGTNVIAGIAVDHQSGAPLVNAPVVSRGKALRGLTDANGRFRFDELGPGTYSFIVQGAGFQPKSGADVAVSEHARVNDVALRAVRTGGIAGIVRDEAGDPVAGIPVTAYQKRVLALRPQFSQAGTARTDDRGMFEIRNLPSAEYLLCACAVEGLPLDPLLLRQLGPTAPDVAGVSRLIDATVRTFAPTYYPGLTRASDSPLVSVDHSDHRTGMDITMYGARPFVVSGQLVQDGGAPAKGMRVMLTQDGDLPGATELSALMPAAVSADGRFRFTGVPAGEYALAAIPQAQSASVVWADVPLAVVDRDVEDLVVPLGHGHVVRGRVDVSDSARGASAGKKGGAVVLIPVEFSRIMMMLTGLAGRAAHGTSAGDNGEFEIAGVPPGRYRVQASMRDGPWQTGEDELVVEPGMPDFVVTMSDRPPAILTGTVALDRYEAPGLALAILFPTDASMWIEPHRHEHRFQSIGVRPDGSFRTHAEPGDYYVARASAFDDDMSVRSFERWSKTAERVTLHAGQITTVTFRR